MSGFADVSSQAKQERDRGTHKLKKGKLPSSGVSGLTQDDIKQCKVFFNTFDRDQNRSIDEWELHLALEAMGQNPTRGDLVKMMKELDTSKNGKLEFSEFLKALQMQKATEKKADAEDDLVSAFVAMGGKDDKSGFINAETLRKVIKDDFGLTIKIDELLDDLDTNSDGFVNFDEFKILLG